MYNDPNQPQPPYGQPPYPQQPPQWGQQPPPQYGVPPIPGYAQPPQPQKKSLRWLWITLGIVGALIVAGCAVCGFLSLRGFNFFAQAIGPTVVAEEYYQAIQSQNYAKAYTYVAPTAQFTARGRAIPVTSEQQFITGAQTLDSLLGPVSKHTITASNSSDTSHLTALVTRNGRQYIVHLTLSQIGNDWKIVSADGI